MDPSHLANVQAIAALEEPTRRQLYELVVRSPAPVSKDEAAAALAIPRTTAAFHLDKLAAEGLLSVVYERRSGRCGPGAGRPAKLYRRSELEVEISLPGRTYDVAGLLLAAALEDAESTGEPPTRALARHATRYGKSLGETARGTRDVIQVLEKQGFEPREDGPDILLGNCPFHLLANEHQQLVCGMNQHLLTGLLDGLGDTDREAILSPSPGHCCVRINQRALDE
ncbi:helix-turn-helix domain-containing protein [Kribbella qitaiheensis]|uniref:Helix-turn-helix domain-containing protein n=1 Tax=Kribbella qitaiheensis TaxID=1544730 RepID=A0A7G6X6S6_9ACTN|nr:helix-turn-helix domain-containing protein [Kribbella qitaiheensis]QNE21941.1 helix-turn-helix domain-containing protein [Kribbella qitaiheensis]